MLPPRAFRLGPGEPTTWAKAPAVLTRDVARIGAVGEFLGDGAVALVHEDLTQLVLLGKFLRLAHGVVLVVDEHLAIAALLLDLPSVDIRRDVVTHTRSHLRSSFLALDRTGVVAIAVLLADLAVAALHNQLRLAGLGHLASGADRLLLRVMNAGRLLVTLSS